VPGAPGATIFLYGNFVVPPICDLTTRMGCGGGWPWPLAWWGVVWWAEGPCGGEAWGMAVVMGRGHGVWRGGVWPRRVVMRQGVQRGRVVGCRLRRGHRGASCDAVAPTVVGVW